MKKLLLFIESGNLDNVIVVGGCLLGFFIGLYIFILSTKEKDRDNKDEEV